MVSHSFLQIFHFDAAAHGVLEVGLKVSEFFGIEIVFNYCGEHNAPHFHARHAGKEGVFSINPLSYMHGNLSPRAVTLVIEWAVAHLGELANCWRLAREMKPVPQIPPLE